MVAHAESAQNPVALVPPSIGEPGLRSAGFVSRRWHVVNERIDLETFARIAKSLRWTCLNKLFDLTREQPTTPARCHMKLEEINDRFKSGNSVPVDRAYLKSNEWAMIYDILKDLAYPNGARLTPEEYAQNLRFALGLPEPPSDTPDNGRP